MPDTPDPAAPAVPRRRRWPRVLLVIVLMLAALVLLAPMLLAPWMAGLLVDEANARLDGRAALSELSIGWGGSVHVGDVSLADAAGQPVLSLRRLDADVDVLAAFSGRYDATVRAEGLRLHLRRDETGALNVETLPRSPPSGEPSPDPGPAPTAPDPDRPHDPLPDLHVDVQLTDAAIVVHDGDRSTTLDELRFSLQLDGLWQPAPFELAARVVGPDGPGGTLALRGEVTLAEGGRQGPDGLRARVDLLLQDVLLAALQPAAAVFADITRLEGTLACEGAFTLVGPLQLDGRTELTVTGLRAEGGPLATPLVVPDTRLLLVAACDEHGTGRQQLELTAGELLALNWAGKAENLAGGAGSLQGALTLDAQLGPLLDALREALPLQPGLQPVGRLSVQLRPQLRLRDGAPTGGEAEVQVRLAGLAARDARGQPVDLGGLQDASLFLRADFDAPGGSVRLEQLVLAAGPVSARAHGGVSGLPLEGGTFDPAALSVSETTLAADADLGQLTELLGRVVDLGGLAGEGTLHLASTLTGGGSRLAADTQLDLVNLRVAGAGVDALHPVDLHLRQRASLDLSPGGRSELEELSLVSNQLEVRATGHVTDVADPARRAGRLEPTVVLHTLSAMQLLEPLLDGLRVGGEDVRLDAVVQLQGAAVDVAGELRTASLGLAGGPVGDEAVRLDDLALALQVQAEGADALRVPRLQLAVGGGLLAGGALPPLELLVSGLAFDGAAGTLDVPELRLDSAPARGGGALHVSGLPGRPVVRADLAFEGDVAEVLAVAAPFVPGSTGVTGAGRWSLALDASGEGQRSTLRPSLKLEDVTLAGLSPDLPLHDVDATLAADLDLDAGADGAALVRSLVLAAPGLKLDATGVARGFLATDPAALVADATAQLEVVPDELSARLGALLGGLSLSGAPLTAALKAGSTGGVHRATLALRGEQLELVLPGAEGAVPGHVREAGLVLDVALHGGAEQLTLVADAAVAELDITREGSTPLAVRGPGLRLGLDADVLTAPGDVTLRRVEVASSALSGSAGGQLLGLSGAAPAARGLHGEFRYVPDQLATLLGPLLPVRLSGADEERLEFKADGPLAGADLRAQLAGLTLDARVGTGTLQFPGLTLRGTTTLAADAGTLRLGGELAANGGAVVLDGALDLRRAAAGAPAPRSQLKVTVTDVRAAGELGGLLATFHPLFAPAAGQVGGVDATLDAGAQLSWEGELPLEALLEGVAGVPLQPLTGTLDLDLGTVQLAGSPLLGELLASLGRGATQSVTVDRMALSLAAGRLRYDEPWDVQLAGVATSFSGSVGLDGTLDLAWSVPVTEELAKRHRFLQRVQGQPLVIPLTGRVDAPKLLWDDALADLAGKAAQQELEDRLGDTLGGLGLPGAAGGGKDEGAAPAADDPEQLLAQADALWKSQPDEARALYKRLKDDFKFTVTYLLNKDRIDERAKKPKAPKAPKPKG